MRSPLLGHNLVRLIYLDEAGISDGEDYQCVAGVLIHGDTQALEVERRFNAIVERHIPGPDRDRFMFHATDIFHGSGYFDRRQWSQNSRLQILTDIADIIGDLKLPVVAGGYEKASFGLNLESIAKMSNKEKRPIIQVSSTIDCVMWADIWLAQNAPDENGMVIAEDTDRVKKLITFIVQVLRSKSLLQLYQLGPFPNLPLQRIVDTVYFAAKGDSPALQLADLCAFVIGRVMKDKTVPDPAFSIILDNLVWIEQYKGLKAAGAGKLIETSASVEQSSET